MAIYMRKSVCKACGRVYKEIWTDTYAKEEEKTEGLCHDCEMVRLIEALKKSKNEVRV